MGDGVVSMGWSHFDFTSGANPYIAMTREERDRVLGNCAKLGFRVEKSTRHGIEFYIVNDRKGR